MERQLPEWMTYKTTVKKTNDSKSSSATQSSRSGNVCDRKLAYVMSPRELQMMAKEILGLK